MTIKEAEENYKYCFGNEGYYMWHELGAKACEEFNALNISREQKGEWDRDIIEQYIDALEVSPEGSSSWFNHVIDALSRGYCKVDSYAYKLLTLMDNMTSLNKENKIFIIKRMGEDTQFHMSGCRFFCMETLYENQMDVVMQKLMDFECTDDPIDPRYPKGPSEIKLYREAIEEYCRAYAKWSGKNMDAEERIKQLIEKNCKHEEPIQQLPF